MTTIATHVCPLQDGMGQPQYISTPGFNGAHVPSTPNINPGAEGVTFLSKTSTIIIDLAPSITPIVEYVSIANTTITNVKRVFVTILDSKGSTIEKLSSPEDSTVVTGFPTSPLPANSTLLITFATNDSQPPYNVTISIIACFHPEMSVTTVSTTAGSSRTSGLYQWSSSCMCSVGIRCLDGFAIRALALWMSWDTSWNLPWST